MSNKADQCTREMMGTACIEKRCFSIPHYVLFNQKVKFPNV